MYFRLVWVCSNNRLYACVFDSDMSPVIEVWSHACGKATQALAKKCSIFNCPVLYQHYVYMVKSFQAQVCTNQPVYNYA